MGESASVNSGWYAAGSAWEEPAGSTPISWLNGLNGSPVAAHMLTTQRCCGCGTPGHTLKGKVLGTARAVAVAGCLCFICQAGAPSWKLMPSCGRPRRSEANGA